MKRMILILILCLFMGGCKSVQTVEHQTIVETVYKDSTIYHNDTLVYQIPKEVYKDYTSLLDTLYLSTKYSKSYAYVDTNRMVLAGEIKSINNNIPIEYKWKDRIITRDTTIYKEVPVIQKEYVTDQSAVIMSKIWKYLCLICLGCLIIMLVLRYLKI